MADLCDHCDDPLVFPGQVCQACLNMFQGVPNTERDIITINDQFKTAQSGLKDRWESLNDDDHPGAGA